MSCPTCDHTMQAIHADDTLRRYWCPRCGTIITSFFTVGAAPEEGGADTISVDVPTLVGRCREFRAARHPSFKAEVGIFGDPVLASEWKRLGIAESINKPEDRPK